jgi:hypothetical protein
MTALRVASQPGVVRMRPQGAIAAIALAVGLTAGIVAGGLRATTPPTTLPTVIPPVAQTDTLATYRVLVDNIQAAELRHDRAALVRFHIQLRELDAEAIGALYLERADLGSRLAIAMADGDSQTAIMLRARLADICGAETVRAYLAFCN